MGKKYIIELEEPEMFDDRKFYTCSQMPWWAVSENIVENLTPYTEPDLEQVRKEAYEKGLADAWAAARKIAISEESGGLTCREMQRIFCTDETDDIFDMSASDAVEKISKYEPEQHQVGDEVVVDSGKCVVLAVDKNGFPAKLLEPDGYTLTLTTDVKLPKTGRHYPQIAEVLAKMKEES